MSSCLRTNCEAASGRLAKGNYALLVILIRDIVKFYIKQH